MDGWMDQFMDGQASYRFAREFFFRQTNLVADFDHPSITLEIKSPRGFCNPTSLLFFMFAFNFKFIGENSCNHDTGLNQLSICHITQTRNRITKYSFIIIMIQQHPGVCQNTTITST